MDFAAAKHRAETKENAHSSKASIATDALKKQKAVFNESTDEIHNLINKQNGKVSLISQKPVNLSISRSSSAVRDLKLNKSASNSSMVN